MLRVVTVHCGSGTLVRYRPTKNLYSLCVGAHPLYHSRRAIGDGAMREMALSKLYHAVAERCSAESGDEAGIVFTQL